MKHTKLVILGISVIVTVLQVASCVNRGQGSHDSEYLLTQTQSVTSVANDSRLTATATPFATIAVGESGILTPTVRAAQLTPTPTQKNVVDTSPLPDVLINLASDWFPLNTCRQYARPGQVWLTQYPYSTARVLLADAMTGFYFPTWSPDHQWIAYIEVHPGQAQQTINPDNIRQLFHNSDSVWVMRADGSGKKMVGGEFSRVESISAGGGCTPVGGVFSIIGWSPDSRWLAFVSVPPEDERDSILYTVNIESGETQIVAHEPDLSSWSPISNAIALVTHTANASEIGIATIDGTNPPVVHFPLPSYLPKEYSIYDIQWERDGQSIYVTGTDEKSSSTSLTLWRIDIASGEWSKVAAWEPNGGAYASIAYGDETYALACASKGGRSNLEIRDPFTWQMVKTIKVTEKMNCRLTGLLRDSSGDNFLSFVSAPHGLDVWVASLKEGDLSPYKVIDNIKLDFPEGYEVANLSWRP